MTTKTTGKAGAASQGAPGLEPEDMQTACQVHTLVQLLYGQLVAGPTWSVPFEGARPFAAHPTAPMVGEHGCYPYAGWTRGTWPS